MPDQQLTLGCEIRRQRVELKGRNGQRPHEFARWLADWRALQQEGWDVHVVVARDESHAIATAIREAPWP